MKDLCFLIILVLFSCTEEENNSQKSEEERDIFGNPISRETEVSGYLLDSSGTFVNQILHQHLMSYFPDLSASEEYTIKVYKEKLNADSITDAVFAINRLSYARKQAQDPSASGTSAQLGYLGPYNAFVYFDGKSNRLSDPVTMYSSAVSPLNVSFENISKENYKDIVVDFRIRNSSFKEIYFMSPSFPKRVFQWKNFDGFGTSRTEAYCFEYKSAQKGQIKNILIYEGKLESMRKGADPYTEEAEISKTNKMVREFFYVEAEGKYFTRKEN